MSRTGYTATRVNSSRDSRLDVSTFSRTELHACLHRETAFAMITTPKHPYGQRSWTSTETNLRSVLRLSESSPADGRCRRARARVCDQIEVCKSGSDLDGGRSIIDDIRSFVIDRPARENVVRDYRRDARRNITRRVRQNIPLAADATRASRIAMFLRCAPSATDGWNLIPYVTLSLWTSAAAGRTVVSLVRDYFHYGYYCFNKQSVIVGVFHFRRRPPERQNNNNNNNNKYYFTT